jgi:hypothetical protein
MHTSNVLHIQQGIQKNYMHSGPVHAYLEPHVEKLHILKEKGTHIHLSGVIYRSLPSFVQPLFYSDLN